MNQPEDDIALRNLMATYTDAVNRFDADQWISTWAEDASWNLLGNPVEGKENILALWQQMMGSFEFALMFPASCKFDIQGNSASGHWYLHEYSRDKAGNTSTILSRYLDEYVKENGSWKFTSRTYNFIYNGPADLSGDFTRPL